MADDKTTALGAVAIATPSEDRDLGVIPMMHSPEVIPMMPAPVRPPVSDPQTTTVTTIPSRGFARGAVVHRQGSSRNMLVVRGFGDVTAVVVIESNSDGDLRLREVPTAELTEVLRSGT